MLKILLINLEMHLIYYVPPECEEIYIMLDVVKGINLR